MVIAGEKLRLTILLIIAAVVCSLAALPAAAAAGATRAATSPDDPVSLLWPRPREVSRAADSQVRLRGRGPGLDVHIQPVESRRDRREVGLHGHVAACAGVDLGQGDVVIAPVGIVERLGVRAVIPVARRVANDGIDRLGPIVVNQLDFVSHVSPVGS